MFRFNGETFKTEPRSMYNHQLVFALGSYRNSPFVTGHCSGIDGKKTEILDYEARQWNQADDYPFSNSYRFIWTITFHYISKKFWTFGVISDLRCRLVVVIDDSLTHFIFQHIALRDNINRRKCLYHRWCYTWPDFAVWNNRKIQ